MGGIFVKKIISLLLILCFMCFMIVPSVYSADNLSDDLIEDMEGEKLYQIKKKFLLFTTTYEIKVFNPNVLPVEQALFLTVILNSIDESAEEE